MASNQKLMLTILFCLLALSCGKNPTELEKIIKVNSKDYFPLAVGNWWKYQSISSGFVLSPLMITRKVQFGDQQYFERAWVNENDTTGREYFRADSSGHVFRYDPEFGEHLIYDFTAKEGEYWQFPSKFGNNMEHYQVTIETVSDTVATLLGIFTGCLRLFFDVPQGIDEEYWQWYARGIGMVKYCFGGGLLKSSQWDFGIILVDTNLIAK